ncbi:type III secretion system outer membrane ring subunit SctC [Serratia liquefaciens]|uniref:type III secretion system outer membrane ring subunit SctC n=1 Tax=Serratia liquefaciens TaxID=614 RepID=UPI00215809CF|nr:type III secretion system outer membrane ring subunit SctC [Serratia liquefaciens]
MKFDNLVKNSLAYLIGIVLMSTMTPALALPQQAESMDSGYIARQDNIKGLTDALSSRMNKPIIISKLVAAKKISGDFELQNPQAFIERISEQLGLIWYHDGQAIYLYDASEMRSVIITLRNTSLSAVSNFLRKSGLYDQRYPLRSDGINSTFYLSGPPAYVELVTNTTKLLDEKNDDLDGRSKVSSIPLFNTFVEDRQFNYRDQKITVPGVANVIRNLLNNRDSGGEITAPVAAISAASDKVPASEKLRDFPGINLEKLPKAVMSLENAMKGRPSASGFKIVANPGTNSLLVKGSSEQIAFVTNIINTLDVPKRHIELSVWIVDLQKDALDQLGVEWNGGVNVGGNLGVSLNGGIASTVDGASFMASILALSQKNQANVVSRPMVLTQENIPAIFDNSRTFYTQLIGERSVELQHVTYGTSVNVLPRFTDADEVEMMLNVEDGSQIPNNVDQTTGLPEVGRTNISTIARVPRGKSLLIGGYTRDESSEGEAKIPFLGDIPLIGSVFKYNKSHNSNMVRVFLIQPREIEAPLQQDASDLISDMKKNLSKPDLHDWMRNYMDSQKWH